MPTREIIGKIVALLVASGSCIASGVLVLVGPRAVYDYIMNTVLGVALVGLGLLILGFGVLILMGILAEARMTRRESQLHVTPRAGMPAPPPAWGMGEVGRIDRMTAAPMPGAMGSGGSLHGGGAVRAMSATMVRWDVPLVIVVALIWTALMTFWLAPR